jgi:ribonuclease HI
MWVGAGIGFTSPQDVVHNYTFRLEFQSTNNIVEYEALLLGMDIVKDMRNKSLKIVGDYNLVIMQVKD